MNRIKTALLSYGMSGEVFHGPLLASHDGFEIAAVLQRSPEKPVRHHHRVVRELDEVLSDRSIELVVVNTPNETHYTYALAALNAGKHVVVEKPFTVTAAEANELIALARRQSRVLSVFQNRRWDGDFLTVRQVVERQQLGKLVEYEAHYDRWRNYVEKNTWKEESAPGTGILYNLGSHMIDQALVLFGLPSFVDARLGVQRPGGKVDDFYDIRMVYGQFMVILKASYLVREPGPRYVLHGTSGSFVKYGLDPQEQALKEKGVPGAAGWGRDVPELWGKLNTESYNGPVETLPGDYPAFYQNIYAAIREGMALSVKAEEARDVIRIIEACAESNRSRCAVSIR